MRLKHVVSGSFRCSVGSRALALSPVRRFTTSASEIQSPDLLDTYHGLVSRGDIEYDEEQIRVIMQLRALKKELSGYVPTASLLPFAKDEQLTPSQPPRPDSHESSPWWSADPDDTARSNTRALVRIQSHAEALAELDTPKGLFLVGPAGAGKSFLLQLFYDSLPTPYKARKHYNQLVLEIYRAVWEESKRRSAAASDMRLVEPLAWTASLKARWNQLLGSGGLMSRHYSRLYDTASEPSIAHAIARRLISHHWLLFFDEIQLLDVSSAGLLADVLSWYWRMGGVMIGSGNKVPDDLYRGGVQRERLEPFVEALKIQCPVLVMREERDWRRRKAAASAVSTWFLSTDEEHVQEFQSLLEGMEGQPLILNVFGRELVVPWAANGVCRFRFADLCEEELGSADYLTVASAFHTVVLTDVPLFPVSAKNQARRFITLLDALYECRCRIVCLAAATPDDIFFPETRTTSRSSPVEDLSGLSGSNEDVMMAEAFSEGELHRLEGFRPNVTSYDTSPSRAVPSTIKPMTDRPLSIFSGEEERFAYARAVSRIYELSSLSSETMLWTPLGSDVRKWEQAARSTLSLSDRSTPRRGPESQEDFASEAAYEGQKDRRRVAAPRLNEDHIWGTREDWGPRSGRWGAGAKAYERPKKEDDKKEKKR